MSHHWWFVVDKALLQKHQNIIFGKLMVAPNKVVRVREKIKSQKKKRTAVEIK